MSDILFMPFYLYCKGINVARSIGCMDDFSSLVDDLLLSGKDLRCVFDAKQQGEATSNFGFQGYHGGQVLTEWLQERGMLDAMLDLVDLKELDQPDALQSRGVRHVDVGHNDPELSSFP